MEDDSLTATPSRAYDLLDFDEREAVDNYLLYVKSEAQRLGDRIGNALHRPIPSDMVRRSKGLLNRPVVRAALAETIAKLSDEQDLSPARLIREIGVMAHSNMEDYIRRGDFGIIDLDLSQCTREQMAAVKSFKIIPTIYGNRQEITLHEKLPATRMLAEMMGLVNSPDGTPPPLLGKADNAPTRRLDATAPDAEKQYLELING